MSVRPWVVDVWRPDVRRWERVGVFVRLYRAVAFAGLHRRCGHEVVLSCPE